MSEPIPETTTTTTVSPLNGRFHELQEHLETLLACAVSTLSDVPQRAFVAPGEEVAWDCEQVWVRVVGIAPRYSQTRQATATVCGPVGWTVRVGVGAIRCVAGMNDQGTPPNSAQVNADGASMTQDMLELMKAIECCDQPAPLQIDQWLPLGPAGGYAGGEWQVTLTFLT